MLTIMTKKKNKEITSNYNFPKSQQLQFSEVLAVIILFSLNWQFQLFKMPAITISEMPAIEIFRNASNYKFPFQKCKQILFSKTLAILMSEMTSNRTVENAGNYKFTEMPAVIIFQNANDSTS